LRRQTLIVEDLYTTSRAGSFYCDGGWNRRAIIALALSGALSIGLSLLGAYR
jgi:nucleobase:cation symporter-1, NCS1 family